MIMIIYIYIIYIIGRERERRERQRENENPCKVHQVSLQRMIGFRPPALSPPRISACAKFVQTS